MTHVHMGINTSSHDGDVWKKKLQEICKIVESEGVAQVYWGCTGRTLHYILAHQLEESLPEYEFDINYDQYRCIVRKK